MGLGSRIIQLRKEKGYTREKLAEILEISPYTLRNYELDVTDAGHSFLIKVSDLFNVSIDYLMGVTDEREKMTSYDLKSSEYDMVEKYRLIKKNSPDGVIVVDTVLNREYAIAGKLNEQEEQIKKMNVEVAEEIIPTRIIAYYQKLASAGSGDYLFDDIPTDFLTVRESEISRNADFVICVDGESMEPDYKDGEKVFVQKTSEIALGEVGIFINDNECFIKELGRDCLISRNKSYPDVVPKNGTRLIGKVIGKVEE